MQPLRILIVEDEVLVADTLRRYLVEQGHEVTGTAISGEEAEALYRREAPDLVLLDLLLNGAGTGIDFARFLQRWARPCPFIYLTSELDVRVINRAQQTFPAGYLCKPIRREDLYAAVELAWENRSRPPEPFLTLSNRTGSYHLPLHNILFLEAEHIKVHAHLTDGRRITQRGALRALLADLPAGQFLRTHRSYAVNVRHVSRWDHQRVFVGERAIPLSRGRRRRVLAVLEGE